LTGAVIAQSIVNGLTAGSIYVLVALGLALILGIMNIVQLAHGEIYMMGAYITYYCFIVAGLPFLLALVISTIVMGAVGVLIERVFYRPFRYGDFLPAVIVATGLMLILQHTASITFGATPKVSSTPFPGALTISGVAISWERLIVIAVTIIFVVALFLLLQRTKIGQAMLAVSQDLQGAALQGISVDRTSSVAMFIGCSMAAAAGSLMGALFPLSPTIGSFALMKGIAVIILGGLGSIPGAIVGGLIIGQIDGIFGTLIGSAGASLVGFVAIILILILRPQGIMGLPSR
jgi:branched-chain amino acid transport system permease protein